MERRKVIGCANSYQYSQFLTISSTLWLTVHMNGFRIGFIGTLSFLMFVAVITGTLGYFPPPEGPKMPEYPKYEATPYQ